MSIDGAPSVESVLNCLISDTESATGSFNDFCANLGYSEDSMKAKRIYDACHRQDKHLKRLFGADYTMFINAERD